ncbi:hypothetical protein [Streptomyces sp. NPDC059874]|uniref:hypothetical protein n=1 Tax=Streptomyces sp. NPDC059874 TaxID=3346983 RepID=UPI00366A1084
MAVVVLATWAGLSVLFIAPSPLPEQWRYYIYSPASVGLWMLVMLVMLIAPFVACAAQWKWIRRGGARA